MMISTEARPGLGTCHSWKDQQRMISEYLRSRGLISFDNARHNPRLLRAQHDDETVTVYQAYNPCIGVPAAENGNFCNSEFSFSRMTWIKPNFSWMMYRSGWASKENQEVVLAIRLWRKYFDELLAQSVPTTYGATAEYATVGEWGKALKNSDVLVQWDPDHHIITGASLPYRVVQLGIRRRALEGFKGAGIASIIDISQQVRRLRKELLSRPLTDPLSCTEKTPLEAHYPICPRISQTHLIR